MQHIEEAHLIERQKPWTKTDKILLIFGVLINVGDGVEMYLPGSIKFHLLPMELSIAIRTISNAISFFARFNFSR
jgi:hypothetical protein